LCSHGTSLASKLNLQTYLKRSRADVTPFRYRPTIVLPSFYRGTLQYTEALKQRYFLCSHPNRVSDTSTMSPFLYHWSPTLLTTQFFPHSFATSFIFFFFFYFFFFVFLFFFSFIGGPLSFSAIVETEIGSHLFCQALRSHPLPLKFYWFAFFFSLFIFFFHHGLSPFNGLGMFLRRTGTTQFPLINASSCLVMEVFFFFSF